MTRHRIRIVKDFDELIATPFSGDINALCWPRQLPGDFREVAERLRAEPGITTIGDDDLRDLQLSAAGRVARDVLIADQAMLRERGLAPALDCVVGHPRPPGLPIPTDVTSFHVDRAPIEVDTYLCTYTGESTEGLANQLAVRRVDVSETRARLLEAYGGEGDDGFAAHLSEHSYDLHYLPLPGAEPYRFGVGNLWRIAIAWPGSPVLPCIHRAPPSPPGCESRLLLIS